MISRILPWCLLLVSGCSLLFDSSSDGGVADANQALLLSALTLSSDVELQPAFASSVFEYDAKTTTLTQPISLTAATDNTNAAIFINDVPVQTGTASPILLDLGPNEIHIDVRSGSESQRYTLRIENDESEQTAYVKASNTAAQARLGGSVSIFGDTMVVGAPNEGSEATGINTNPAPLGEKRNSGAVYVFRRTSESWAQEAYIKASNTGVDDKFGSSVAIFGDTLVVGAWGESSIGMGIGADESNDDSTNSGAVYVFRRGEGVWEQEAYIKASNTGEDDHFGASVAIYEDTIAVGAWGEDGDATATNGGAVYVFQRIGSVWSQQAYIKASTTDAEDLFGRKLALWGDTLVVASLGEDSNAQGLGGDQTDNTAEDSGAVYVFQRSEAAWSQQAYIKGHNTSTTDVFGVSVALSANTLAVGANFKDNKSGAAYVFRRTGDTWTQEQYLKASNSAAEDRFGVAVALSQDVLVVGADREDSQNITGNDNGLENSGAAYVFQRHDGTWTQQQFLKAANRGAEDFFGQSIAISQGILAVCATEEDGSSVGVNGPDNDDASNSGAVYLFE